MEITWEPGGDVMVISLLLDIYFITNAGLKLTAKDVLKKTGMTLFVSRRNRVV